MQYHKKMLITHNYNGDIMFLLCLKVFVARMIDVSLGTIRTMFIVKGNKIVASVIAFLEVLVWFYASKSIFSIEENGFIILLFYALGYGAGTLIGTIINEIFISGIYSVQVITSSMGSKDINFIKKCGFGVTVLESVDSKKILFLEINKKRYKECIKLIKSLDKKSFIVVNDSKVAYNGYVIK